MPKTYDIAVLGATPAGYAAALALAGRGRDVAVVDCPGSRTESPLADWAPAELFRARGPLRPVMRAGTEGAFRAVRFHSPQLDREATYRQRATAGFVLRRERLLKALAAEAMRAGIRQVRASRSLKPQLEEADVLLAGRSRVRAALLLIAQDSPAEVMAKLNLPARAVPTGRLTIWGVDVPLRGQSQRDELDDLLHVVAFENADRLGMFFRAGDVLHVRILAHQPEAQPPAAGGGADALGELIGGLQHAGLLPPRLNLARASAARWRPPGGVALELETHLAKRTLLVGTAGGFASAMSGQTLDAGVRSALVAADVADRALRSGAVQDALADYKKQWRGPLADRIRPTGTSLRMLMPMVLSNQAMTARFARALLYGEGL